MSSFSRTYAADDRFLSPVGVQDALRPLLHLQIVSTEDKRNHKQNQKDDEENFGNPRRCPCNSPKSENGSNESNN